MDLTTEPEFSPPQRAVISFLEISRKEFKPVPIAYYGILMPAFLAFPFALKITNLFSRLGRILVPTDHQWIAWDASI